MLIDRLAVIAWLLLPVPLRAVPLQPAGPVAVPGTADVQPAGGAGWYLLIRPQNPLTTEELQRQAIHSHLGRNLWTIVQRFTYLQRHPWPPNPLAAPLLQWIKWTTFTSEKECRYAAKNWLVGYHYPMLVEPGGPLFFIVTGNSSSMIVDKKNIRCVAANDPRLRETQR
jgi:hypothetical protein